LLGAMSVSTPSKLVQAHLAEGDCSIAWGWAAGVSGPFSSWASAVQVVAISRWLRAEDGWWSRLKEAGGRRRGLGDGRRAQRLKPPIWEQSHLWHS
jgi:hypothetical protein